MLDPPTRACMPRGHLNDPQPPRSSSPNADYAEGLSGTDRFPGLFIASLLIWGGPGVKAAGAHFSDVFLRSAKTHISSTSSILGSKSPAPYCTAMVDDGVADVNALGDSEILIAEALS